MTKETIRVACVKLDFMENSATWNVRQLALVAAIKSVDIVSLVKMEL